MADVISRLKLDSGEFDSKIKRAGQELMAYSEHCKKMGLEMGYANKDAKDFAKALGSMQTTSSSARGKINELTEAFVNLKVMYKNMTDEEKNNTFGKNLAASLDQLKTRIDQAKAELNDVNKELGNTKQAEVDTKGGLEGLTSALGINIKTLAGWGTAIAAGKMALDVAKDAFFASESSVDEWGRTVASSQSLYEGFLTAINNGDISGYLSNIDSIVKAARLAYDELDKLGTMKTIQAPQISKQQTENERIRSMIQTGRYIAPQDGRKNAVFNGREMQTGDKLTAGQIRALEKQLQGGMQKVVKLVGNEVDQTGKAINAYYDKLAKTNGMSLQEFKKGTSSWAEFTKRMQGYEDYKKFENEHSSVRERYNPTTQEYESYVIRDQEKNPYQQYAKWGTFRVDKEGDNSYKDLVALIQQRDQQVGQVYSTQAQAYRTMNRAEGLTVRQIMGGTGGKGGKGGTTDKNLDAEQQVQQKINDLLKEALTADAYRQGEIRQQVAELQKQQEKYKDIKNLAQGILPKDKEAVFTIDGQLSEETKKNLREIQGVTIDDKTMTVTADTADALRALQGIEGVTIDPKTVTITATDEALPKLRDIQGITIDDKTMTVMADTADALRALQGIEGVTIDPKTVTITATDEALPKLRDIQGITIDDKMMTVTAETADALRALQGIEGVTIDPKTVTITATDEALPKLREIQGVTIDDKAITVTAETADALRALQGIEGVTIDPKTVTITATDEALPKLRDIQGITIDDKMMTVTADTADALRALQGIEGVTIDPKTVTITATDEALPKLRDIQGITIDDKTMTVMADTADALRALQGIEGVTIDPKTVTITTTDEALPKLRDIQGITIDDKTMTVTADTQEAMQKVQELIGQVSTTTLQMKVAPPDLDKLFPDMSKENYNTGYAGSAQAKYDSARVDLALGPMNFDAINDYIGSIKGMLKDADLGDELYTSMTEKLKDATTVSTLLQEMMERGLAGADLESTAQALKEKLLSPEGIDQTAIQSFLEELNKQIEEAGGVPLKLNAGTGEVTDKKGKDDGEELKKFNEGIGKLSGGLSQVTGGLKAVGVEIPKEVDQVIGVINGVSQIISGVGTIISIFQTSAITANTIALGALTSAVWASVVSNAIPFFSGGGIVPAFAQGGTIPKFAEGRLIGRAAGGLMIPGNSMSGDNLRLPVDGGRGMIGVNSGELILNKSSQNSLAASLLQAESLVDSISDYRVSLGNAQQMSMASQLEGGAAAAENTQPFVNGEQIFLGLQAYMRRSGLGEIVTSER